MGLKELVQTTPGARTVLAGPLALRRAWMRYRAEPASRIIDRLGSFVVSDVRVKVPEFEGEFYIGPKSHLLARILRNGEYEREIAHLFLSKVKPDRDVLDIGANIGFFSVLAAKHLTTGRVLAAEPTQGAVQRLRTNLEVNGVANKVIVFNGLVGDARGEHELHVVPGREEYSSIGNLVHPSVRGQAAQVETIGTLTLDDLVEMHGLKPALLKVDVEGAEAKVLAGAQKVLTEHRPIVLSELAEPLLRSSGSSPAEVVAMLERCGYDVRDASDETRSAAGLTYGEIIAVPR